MDSITFRRHLHSQPELSFKEYKTQEFISEELRRLGIEHHKIADTGILARIEGAKGGADSRCVVLRADIDALPVCEASGVEFASKNDGVMHACGHDIHAAVLFGVLKELSIANEFEGTLFGLFQPAEECNPGGAIKVLDEMPFERYDVRGVVALHVEPELEVGTLGFREGQYMAASDELRFRINGKGGHAAMRHKIIDPIAAAAEFITPLLAMNSEQIVLSIGDVRGEGATNVIPDIVTLQGTLRTFDQIKREESYTKIHHIADTIEKAMGVNIETDISIGFPSVVNDKELTRRAIELAKSGGINVELLPLRTTAEDFGHYTQRYPSLLYRLGVGHKAGALHSAKFAPDERAIAVGIDYMTRLALKILK